MDKSRPRPQKGPSGAFPPSGNRLCRASHRASTSLAPYGLPAPCQARHQASSIVTSPIGTALISAPQRGVKGAIAPTAPGREPKNAPAEAGEGQSARELRSLLSCFGYAYAADSTSLVACGPQNRLTAVPAPLLVIQKRRLESAPLRSGKGKQAFRPARRPKARRSELLPGVRQGLPVCVACAGF